jgi:uncharacterized protein YdhG (YjbR/CyaY superfamily)
MSKATSKSTTNGFSAEERAAMKERAAELKAQSRGDKADAATAVLEKISQMPAADREVAERLHAVITSSAPDLAPRLWYGMPAYAKDGKVLCFFQPASKFKARYGTLGFSDEANLDDGDMWSTSFGLKRLTANEEARICALVKQAVS